MSIQSWSLFDSIESKYDLSKIRFGDIPVWPVIRMHICLNLIDTASVSKSYRFKRLLTMIRGVFYGLNTILGKTDTIIISNSTLRVKYGARYYDRCFEQLSDHLGCHNTLIIERPSPNHHSHSLCVSTRLMSYGFFYFLSLFVKKPKVTLEGNDVLNAVLNDLQANFNVEPFMIRFYRLYRVFLWFFSLKQPKRVFVTCYYGEMAAVLAAKRLKIKVIELQHGHLYGGHQAYFPKQDLSAECIPNEFWAYSPTDRQELQNGSVYCQSEIKVVGHDFLSLIRQNPFYYPDLVTFKSQFKRLVCITSQYVIESDLVEFVKNAARQSPDIGYIFIPRAQLVYSYTDYGFPDNVKVVVGYTTYGVIQHCDTHATVFSTCAVEAPFLGVPTVLIDINGIAMSYFGKVLDDDRLFRFVSSPTDFILAILNFSHTTKSDIMTLSERWMSPYQVPNGLL
jgi:hypothetical protein